KSNFVKCENGGATGADSCTDSEGEKFSSCKQLTCFDGGYHITPQTNMHCSKITYAGNSCYNCNDTCAKAGYFTETQSSPTISCSTLWVSDKLCYKCSLDCWKAGYSASYENQFPYETVFLENGVCYKDCQSEIRRLYPNQFIDGNPTADKIGYALRCKGQSGGQISGLSSSYGLLKRQLSRNSFTDIPLCMQIPKCLINLSPTSSQSYNSSILPAASLEDFDIEIYDNKDKGIMFDSKILIKETDYIATILPEAGDMITRHKVSNLKNISLTLMDYSSTTKTLILIPGSYILTIEGDGKFNNYYLNKIDVSTIYSILLTGNKNAGEYTGQNVYSVLYVKPGATLTVDQPICVDTAAGGRIINEGTINGTIIENCTDYE
ncbi:MAG: hypothetical protein PHE89_06920, partial [Alphaproteobacteria bacterium]|nr:hypothetical protein [Alphaproteobacteria bacterium]